MKAIVCLFLVAFVGIASSKFAHVSYTVFSDRNYQSVNMTFAVGGTAWDVVALQAWLDEDNWGVNTTRIEDYGRVITSIGGLANDLDERVAWHFYVVPEYPATQVIPDDKYISATAVDNTPVVDDHDQHFLFVYREIKNKN